MLCQSQLLIHSLEEVLPGVKSGFQLPNVIQRQRAKSHRAVFIYLYQAADEQSLITLDAEKIGRAIGYSRKTVYKSVTFLKRVNLLKIKVFREGRGNHSIYQLNWKKNRHPLSINKIKSHSLRNDRAVKIQRNNRTPWGRMMQAFRKLLARTFMLPQEQRLCAGVIGRFLKKRPIESCKLIYHHLAKQLHLLEPPNWVLKIQDLCRWFWGILKAARISCPI